MPMRRRTARRHRVLYRAMARSLFAARLSNQTQVAARPPAANLSWTVSEKCISWTARNRRANHIDRMSQRARAAPINNVISCLDQRDGKNSTSTMVSLK